MRSHESLWAEHVGILRLYALKLAGSRDLAEEFLQECRVRTYIKFPKLHNPYAFGVWAKEFIWYIWLDARQKAAKTVSLDEMVTEDSDEFLDLLTISRETNERHIISEILANEFMDSLEPKNRDLVGHFVQGWGITDYAKEIGVSKDCANSRYWNIRRRCEIVNGELIYTPMVQPRQDALTAPSKVAA